MTRFKRFLFVFAFTALFLPEASRADCDLKFEKLNLCAMVGIEGSRVVLSFYNKDQGAAQQPFLIDPGAAKLITVLYYVPTGASLPLKLSSVRDDDDNAVDGVYEGKLSFKGPGFKLILRLEGQDGLKLDSAMTSLDI